MAETIDATQLSPQIRQYIEDQIKAAKAADAAAGAPKELSPQEKVDAALKVVNATEARERPAPGHNDAVVGAIITYLNLCAERDAIGATANAPASDASTPEESAPVADVTPAVQVTAPAAGD